MIDARILYAPNSCTDVDQTPCHAPLVRARILCLTLITAISLMLVPERPANAVTPESPEVREMIDRALKSLEGHTERRLGGLCLIALAFVKEGAPPDSPHVLAALEACRNAPLQRPEQIDNYSNGLAIIFLSELNPGKYRDLIAQFAKAMQVKQKEFGGWGYRSEQTGDTSQTQYAALSCWELLQVGMPPAVEEVEACTNWLLRTQDPSGVWGYQGKDPGKFARVRQSDTSLSMLAAGLGSTMIFGNVLGLTNPGGGTDLPVQEVKEVSALKKVEPEGTEKKQMKRLSGDGVDRERLMESIALGQSWYEKNYDPAAFEQADYPYYVLYSLERYKSFEELLLGDSIDEPDWYQHGVDFLKQNELSGGGWNSRSRQPCATAFGILFLIRSTQKSIKASMGLGTLVGGRGLSANLARMKMRRGKLVIEEKPTKIDEFLGMLDGEGSEALEALVNDPNALQVANVGPEQARRLQQIVKSGDATGRILAVRALAKMRSLDYVPSLIFALTDPDNRVVREARDGLRFVSRRFDGYGLADNFTDSERYNAIDKWKTWYRQVRPAAPPLP